MKIYLLRDGVESGPFTRDEIFARLRTREIEYLTQARTEEEPEWKALQEVLNRTLFSKEKIETQSIEQALSVEVPIFEIKRSKPIEKSNRRPRTLQRLLLTTFVLLLGFAAFRYAQEDPSTFVVVDLDTNSPAPPTPLPASLTPAKKESISTPRIASSPPRPTVPPIAPSAPSSAAIVSSSQKIVAAPSPTKTVVQQSAPTPSPVVAKNAAITPVRDFFSIQSVKLLKTEPKDGTGVWSFKELTNSENRKYKVPDQFQPCLEVKVSTLTNTRSDKIFARVYFFNKENKLIARQTAASPSGAGTAKDRTHFALPIIFHKEATERFFFEVPKQIRNEKWKAVVVFGDKYEARSACFPPTETDFLLTYPERTLVYDRTAKKTDRKPAMDPLIEHVVKTRNPKMPQVTLFLRTPVGVTDASEIRGVLAVCVLGASVESVKRELQKEELAGDYKGLYGFANKHKLAIIAWGSNRLWDPSRNYEDLSREEKRETDAAFDLVSNAWERGVTELAQEYGLPTKDFLLWGACGSAQWAHRLCLRKPQYFLAIGIHIPGSFDKPTLEANKVLWCLTTGELYGGYERAKKFVAECQKLGYPFVFKAIVGLGHAGHPDATALNFEFFEFALSQKALREEYDKNRTALSNRAELLSAGESLKPWPQIFQTPPFYGDIVNQEVYPADQLEMIPAGFRIPLPSKKIASIWSRSK